MGRCIFFDVDGVIITGYHFRPELRRAWDEHMEADLGISREVFFKAFIRTTFVDDVLPGKKALVNALDDVLPTLGYQGSAMDIAAYWLERDSHLNRPLLDILRTLPKDLKLYLATNQEHMRALHLWQTLGLEHVFRDIFYSARMGVKKPEAAYFDHVMMRIGPQDQPPLFFDDTPEVVEAAQAAGWEAVLYNSLEDFTGHPFIRLMTRGEC